MKNPFLSFAFLLAMFSGFNAAAQVCTPVQLNKYGFFTPSNDSVICLDKGQSFTEVFYFKFPAYSGAFTIQYIKFDSVTHLPPGATATFNKPLGSMYAGNENGCVTISGVAPNIDSFERIRFYIALKVAGIPAEFNGELSDVFSSIQSDSTLKGIYWQTKNPGGFCKLWISGKVFADGDQNCTYGNFDLGLSNQKVTLDNSKLFFTDALGDFRLNTDALGTHTFEVDTSDFKIQCGSVNRIINIQSLTQDLSGNDFAMQPDTTFRDLCITFNPYGWWLFGYTGSGSIVYQNKAFVPVNAVIKMSYDTILKYSQSDVPPFALDTVNRLIEWQLASIPPRSQGTIQIQFQLPFPIAPSFPIHNTLWILPDSADATPQNNIFKTNNLITGAYDPNDKQVSPNGVENDGRIGLADSVLTYRVRFQNTGTGPALKVVIIDTLDNDLNLMSFRPGLASHSFSTALEGNIATFTFANIMLPDSNTNEPESHGFVDFSVKKKAGLGYGTVIDNSASIYFDFNEPIKTNTVTSTYFNFISSLKEDALSETVAVYPNPAHNMVYVTAQSDIQLLNITDITGKTVHQHQPMNPAATVDVSTLANGIWYLSIKTEKGVVNRRFVKQ